MADQKVAATMAHSIYKSYYKECMAYSEAFRKDVDHYGGGLVCCAILVAASLVWRMYAGHYNDMRYYDWSLILFITGMGGASYCLTIVIMSNRSCALWMHNCYAIISLMTKVTAGVIMTDAQLGAACDQIHLSFAKAREWGDPSQSYYEVALRESDDPKVQ